MMQALGFERKVNKSSRDGSISSELNSKINKILFQHQGESHPTSSLFNGTSIQIPMKSNNKGKGFSFAQNISLSHISLLFLEVKHSKTLIET